MLLPGGNSAWDQRLSSIVIDCVTTENAHHKIVDGVLQTAIETNLAQFDFLAGMAVGVATQQRQSCGKEQHVRGNTSDVRRRRNDEVRKDASSAPAMRPGRICPHMSSFFEGSRRWEFSQEWCRSRSQQISGCNRSQRCGRAPPSGLQRTTKPLSRDVPSVWRGGAACGCSSCTDGVLRNAISTQSSSREGVTQALACCPRHCLTAAVRAHCEKQSILGEASGGGYFAHLSHVRASCPGRSR